MRRVIAPKKEDARDLPEYEKIRNENIAQKEDVLRKIEGESDGFETQTGSSNACAIPSKDQDNKEDLFNEVFIWEKFGGINTPKKIR